jgi:hypothetical protein
LNQDRKFKKSIKKLTCCNGYPIVFLADTIITAVLLTRADTFHFCIPKQFPGKETGVKKVETVSEIPVT